MKTIGEVCELVNGGTPKTSVPEYWGGTYQWVTPAEMGKRPSPYIDETERTLTDAGIRNCSASPLPPKSLILSSRAPIGHLVINTVPMSFNQGCKGLIPKPSLHYKFLYYFLFANVELLNSLGTGATFKELSGGKLKEVKLPIPSLDEQMQIVEILDEAFEGLATAASNAERNLASSRELFDAELASVFVRVNDTPTVLIRDACEEIVDCLNRTAPIVEGETPFKMLRTTNVRAGKVSLDTVRYVSEETYRVWTRRQVPQAGDVLLTREAPLGEVGMIEGRDNVFLGQRLVSYRADRAKLEPQFLLYCLQSKPLQQQIHRLGSGATVQHMRVPDSKALRIPLPTLNKQRDLIEKLNYIAEQSDALVALYQTKLTSLIELRRAVLAKALSVGFIPRKMRAA
jgi:type I restriction enzyme S subunit